MNPTIAANARTARLAREAVTPVYSTSTPTPEVARQARITKAQDSACTEDFCFICSRATDHWGEHSDDQILAWASTPRAKWLMG